LFCFYGCVVNCCGYSGELHRLELVKRRLFDQFLHVLDSDLVRFGSDDVDNGGCEGFVRDRRSDC